MNTPTHIIVNYALLSDTVTTKKERWSAVLGGIIPDIGIYVLFFYAFIAGIPQSTVWGEIYFQPGWQLAAHLLHSFPLFIALGVLAWLIKKRWLLIFAISGFLHALADFFTHADDAHRQFLPFSDYRFESPISYWDRNFNGEIGGAIEMSLLLVAITYLWTRIKTRWIKVLLLLYIVFSAAMSLLAPFIFG